MLCIRRKIGKDRDYLAIHITSIVKRGLIKPDLVNVYVYRDYTRKQLIYFNTRKVSKKKVGDKIQYIIRLVQFRKAPLLYRSTVFVCLEDIDKYTKRM